MEQVIQSLQNALVALKEWQQSDKTRALYIAELEAENKRLTQAALPQVSVSGKLLEPGEANVMQVYWLVTSNTDQQLQVKVRHTDTGTGKDKDYTWGVTGKTGAAYTYPLNKVSDSVNFSILPGEGYQVKGEPVSIPVPKQTPIAVPNINFGKPFQITKGGTYKGDWKSKNTEIPAVDILTQEPVVIENSTIAGAGYLIKHWAGNANLIVRHTKGIGLEPTAWKEYKKPRRFLIVSGFKSILVEHCELEGTAGILLGGSYQGNGSERETFKIRFNRALNIDGRIHSGKDLVQFFQANFKGAISHAEVCWNRVLNEPGKSAVEDNINIYNTRGTKASPIRIHNNLIQGAYPMPHTANKYTGGGIITDGDGDANTCSAFVEAYENYLINLGNYSMGIAGGNNIHYHHNVAVNAAMFADGSRFPFYTSGIWSSDYYKKNSTFGNILEYNKLGINAWGWPDNRRDISDALHATYRHNEHLKGPITTGTERLYVAEWEMKYKDKLGVL